MSAALPQGFDNVNPEQIKSFREFLMSYNKLSEICFVDCAWDFTTRNVKSQETRFVTSVLRLRCWKYNSSTEDVARLVRNASALTKLYISTGPTYSVKSDEWMYLMNLFYCSSHFFLCMVMVMICLEEPKSYVKEKCALNCTEKYLKMNQRISQRFQEYQMITNENMIAASQKIAGTQR